MLHVQTSTYVTSLVVAYAAYWGRPRGANWGRPAPRALGFPPLSLAKPKSARQHFLFSGLKHYLFIYRSLSSMIILEKPLLKLLQLTSCLRPDRASCRTVWGIIQLYTIVILFKHVVSILYILIRGDKVGRVFKEVYNYIMPVTYIWTNTEQDVIV